MTPNQRTSARLAGILYFVTHITSVLALVVYGDASSGPGLRTGVALELVLALGCAGTGILLFTLLRTAGEVRALTFALLRTLEAAIILAGALPMLALADGAASGAGPRAALVGLHDASFLVGQGLVIGANTIVLGSLLLTSALVPRGLALLGIGGGVLVLASDLAQLFDLMPRNGAIAAVCAAPVFVFEIWFAITLIAAGLRGRTPQPAAA